MCAVLCFEPMASHMLGRYFTTGLHLQPSCYLFRDRVSLSFSGWALESGSHWSFHLPAPASLALGSQPVLPKPAKSFFFTAKQRDQNYTWDDRVPSAELASFLMLWPLALFPIKWQLIYFYMRAVITRSALGTSAQGIASVQLEETGVWSWRRLLYSG